MDSEAVVQGIEALAASSRCCVNSAAEGESQGVAHSVDTYSAETQHMSSTQLLPHLSPSPIVRLSGN